MTYYFDLAEIGGLDALAKACFSGNGPLNDDSSEYNLCLFSTHDKDLYREFNLIASNYRSVSNSGARWKSHANQYFRYGGTYYFNEKAYDVYFESDKLVAPFANDDYVNIYIVNSENDLNEEALQCINKCREFIPFLFSIGEEWEVDDKEFDEFLMLC